MATDPYLVEEQTFSFGGATVAEQIQGYLNEKAQKNYELFQCDQVTSETAHPGATFRFIFKRTA